MLVHVKDSMQMVENAILEKEQAQVSDKQKVQEITRLKNVISEILNEAGERTRKEVCVCVFVCVSAVCTYVCVCVCVGHFTTVSFLLFSPPVVPLHVKVDEVRAEYNKNVESMAEEIRQLELVSPGCAVLFV